MRVSETKSGREREEANKKKYRKRHKHITRLGDRVRVKYTCCGIDIG